MIRRADWRKRQRIWKDSSRGFGTIPQSKPRSVPTKKSKQYLESQGTLASRLLMGITGVSVWLTGLVTREYTC